MVKKNYEVAPIKPDKRSKCKVLLTARVVTCLPQLSGYWSRNLKLGAES